MKKKKNARNAMAENKFGNYMEDFERTLQAWDPGSDSRDGKIPIKTLAFIDLGFFSTAGCRVVLVSFWLWGSE